MRVLLRSVESKQYVLAPGQWTDQPSAARNFETSARALSCAREFPAEHLEIVLAFDEHHFEIGLPLRPNERSRGDVL